MKDLSLAELIIQHGSETRAANEYVELVENRNMVEQITNSAKQNESDAIIRNAPEGATEIWFGETERVGDYAKRAPSGEWLLYDADDKRWYDASLADVQWRSHHNLSDLKKDRAAAKSNGCHCRKKEVAMSDLTKQLKHAAWNTALTLAHNICIQESDQHNGNDELDEANTACYCAKRIRQFLDADDESLNEMMLEAGFASAIKSADLIEQLQARVVELEQKEAELKAYVERLRGVVTEYHDENIACEEALNTLWEIHNTTPQQNLNALRREAFIDGFYSSGDGFNGEWVGDKNTLDKLANEYANTKYPSGKE